MKGSLMKRVGDVVGRFSICIYAILLSLHRIVEKRKTLPTSPKTTQMSRVLSLDDCNVDNRIRSGSRSTIDTFLSYRNAAWIWRLFRTISSRRLKILRRCMQTALSLKKRSFACSTILTKNTIAKVAWKSHR